MEITLRQRLEQFSHLNQTRLFDFLEQQAGSLTDKTRLLVSALGMLPLSRLIAPTRGWKGRRSKDRQSLASALELGRSGAVRIHFFARQRPSLPEANCRNICMKL